MKTLVSMRFGSHLYGTDTLSSDTDYKNVFIPDARSILLQQASVIRSPRRVKAFGERNTASDVDDEAIPLHRFMALLADGQTMALDMLFAPDEMILGPVDPLWHELRANRMRVVSRKAATFLEYCRTQANKYGLKGSRIHALRNILEWFDQAIAVHGHHTRLGDVADTLEAFIADRQLDHTNIIGIARPTSIEPLLHLECCNRKAPFSVKLQDTRSIYVRALDQYGDRAQKAEQNENVDWKALSHAVRVGTEALELLSTGWITFPLPNAAHVLDIKLGRRAYREVAEEIESLLEQVESAMLTSPLPDMPDVAFIDDFIVGAYRDYICSR